jgi:hypothetical protein
MKLIVEVENCSDCPCLKNVYGHGESFEYCDHKDAPRGYGNIIPEDQFKRPPVWCPIKG